MEKELLDNPRRNIWEYIQNNNLNSLMLSAGQIHGHFCPGLAIGVMGATFAMQQINTNSDGMEDLLAIVETNNCVSDGIQFVTGCTFGNNSLIFKDIGKTAFTLTKRDGKGIRISTKNDSRAYIKTAHKYFSAKYKEVVKEQNHSENEIDEFKKLGVEAAFAVLTTINGGIDYGRRSTIITNVYD